MTTMRQLLGLAALSCVLSLSVATSHGQSVDADQASRQTARGFDAVGMLVRNQEAGNGRRAAPFVLVDKEGVARCYVTSRVGAKLSDYLNMRVGVRGSVRFVAGDPLPLIVAEAVQPVGDKASPPRATLVASQPAAGPPPTSTRKRATPNVAEPRHIAEPQREPDHVAAAEPADHVQPAAHTTRVARQPQEPTLAELPAPVPETEDLLVVEPQNDPPAVDAFPPAATSESGADENGEPAAIEIPHSDCDCEVCSGTSCTTCSACCRANDPGEWFVRAEYLAWATKGMYVPPLATTGPSATNPGILGRPGTVLLFGDEPVNGDLRSGGRIGLGKWLNPQQTWGVNAEYFGLQDASQSFFAASDANGVPTISRPYFTVYGVEGNGTLKAAGQNAELVALQGVLSGSLQVETTNAFQGGGVFLRHNFCCKNTCWGDCDDCKTGCTTSCSKAGSSGVPGGVRVGMFGGYRFMLLDDGVSITEDLTAISTSPVDQGQFLINDSFNSYNQFHGAELGFVAEARRARWTFELLSRLALGSNQQTVRINGSTVISGSQQDDGTYSGGLLALPTNIGSYSRNQFSVIPQLNANIGYNITPRLRAIAGYTFIYWGNVARAGDQISLDVNETYIPASFDTPSGPRRPAFVWQSNDFWAQGLNLGLDYFW